MRDACVGPSPRRKSPRSQRSSEASAASPASLWALVLGVAVAAATARRRELAAGPIL